eukprot:2516778-Rhodomonas_salina.1
MERDRAVGLGRERVLDAAQVASHDRKEVGGLRERILPLRKVQPRVQHPLHNRRRKTPSHP